jgi:hypothetical protein
MSRVHDALRRLCGLKPGEIEEPDEQPATSEGPGRTPLPPAGVFVSPWQFEPADEVTEALAGASGTGLGLPEPVIAAAAGFPDRDSGDGRRGLDCRCEVDARQPRTQPAGCPPKINGTALAVDAGTVRLSPKAELGEAGSGLTVASQETPAAPGQPGAWQAHGIRTRLAHRIAAGQGPPLALAQAAFEDLLAAVGAARGRLVVRTPDVMQPVPFAVVGDWLTTTPLPGLEPVRTEFGPDSILTTVRLTGGGAAGAEFHADGTPFTQGQTLLAEAGMTLIGTWLSGVTSATSGRAAGRVGDVQAPALDAGTRGETERVKRLSLKGGVLVARFKNGGPPEGWTVASVIEAIRKELRSSDVLGQLPTGEITALLVRASADNVASVAWRVRKRLGELARDRRLPPIELRHGLYPDGSAESPSALVERTRSTVTCESEALVQG